MVRGQLERRLLKNPEGGNKLTTHFYLEATNQWGLSVLPVGRGTVRLAVEFHIDGRLAKLPFRLG